jgi:hypothetical protein
MINAIRELGKMVGAYSVDNKQKKTEIIFDFQEALKKSQEALERAKKLDE